MNPLLLAALGLPLLWSGTALAQKPVKIGVLNDMSGVYSDYQGVGSVVAAQMAIDDFGKVLGETVELTKGDHQNKPDTGLSIARLWYDTAGVDMIIDVPNSPIALAIADLSRQKNKVFIGSGAGTDALTGARCSPNTVHWSYDTWQVGHALGSATVKRGGDKWYFLTADYGFGYDLEANSADAVRKAGGTVVGSSRHPLGADDFSSFLLSAQNSGANVLGLANAGGDTVNTLKQAKEFGLTPKMVIAGPLININTIDALGLAATQGVTAVMPYYWDLNDDTRAFSKRFSERHPRHLVPNEMQAGVYSATLHYLKAVAKVGNATDGAAVVAAMKAMPTDDPVYGQGSVRADGREMHPVYLMQTKTVAESKSRWDMFKVIATVPAEQAFRPLADGKCVMAGMPGQ